MSYEFGGKKVTIDVDLNLMKFSSNEYHSLIRNHLLFINNLQREHSNKVMTKSFLVLIYSIYAFFSIIEVFSNAEPQNFLILLPLLIPFIFIGKIIKFNREIEKIQFEKENTKLYLNYSDEFKWDNTLKFVKNMNGVTKVTSFNQIFFNQSVIKLNASYFLIPKCLLNIKKDSLSVTSGSSLLTKMKLSYVIFQKKSILSYTYKFSEFDHSHWLHQRKDGGPDNRYRENYIIEYRKAHILYFDTLPINLEYYYIYDEIVKNFKMELSKDVKPFLINVDDMKKLSYHSLDELKTSTSVLGDNRNKILESQNKSLLNNTVVSSDVTVNKVLSHIDIDQKKNVQVSNLVNASKNNLSQMSTQKTDNSKTIDSKNNSKPLTDIDTKTTETKNTTSSISQKDTITHDSSLFEYTKKFENIEKNRYSSDYKNYVVYKIVSGTALKPLTKEENLDEKTTRGWLYKILETFEFDPYQRDEWLNNETLLKKIAEEGIAVFSKSKDSKNPHNLSLSVEKLDLSIDVLNQLRLCGIDKLIDFNTFTIKELKMLLGEHIESLISVLKKYALPRPLDNLGVSKDVIEQLKKHNIENLLDLLESNRKTISQIFEDNVDFKAAINEVLAFYNMVPLKIQIKSSTTIKDLSPSKKSINKTQELQETTIVSESKQYIFNPTSGIEFKISTSNIDTIIDLIWNKNHSISQINTGDNPSIFLVPETKKSLITKYISKIEKPYILLFSLGKDVYQNKDYTKQMMLTYKFDGEIDYGQTLKINDFDSSNIGIVIGKSNVLKIPEWYDDAIDAFGKHTDYFSDFDVKYILNDAIQKVIQSKSLYTKTELLYLTMVANELSFDISFNETHYTGSVILTALKALYNKISNQNFVKDYFFRDTNLSVGIQKIKEHMKQGQIEEFLNQHQTQWIDFLAGSRIKNASKELKDALKFYMFSEGRVDYEYKDTNKDIYEKEKTNVDLGDLSQSISYSTTTNLSKLEDFCIKHTEKGTTVKHNPEFGSLVKNKKVYSNAVTTFIFKPVLSQYKNILALKSEVINDSYKTSLEAKEKRINYLKLIKDFEQLIKNFFLLFKKEDAEHFIRALLSYALENNINKTNKFFAIQPLLMISNVNVLDIVGTHSFSYDLNSKGYPDYFRKSMNVVTGLNNVWIGITNIALRDEKGAKEIAKQAISNPLFLKAPKSSFEDYLKQLNKDSFKNELILNYRGSMLYKPSIHEINSNNSDFLILQMNFSKNEPLDKLAFSRVRKFNGLVFTEKIGSQIKNFIGLHNKLYDIDGVEVKLNDIDIYVANTTYMGESYYMWEMIATAYTGYFINNLLFFRDNFSKNYPKLKQKSSIYKQTEFIDKSQIDELKTIQKVVVIDNKKGIAPTLDLGERQLTPVIIDDKLAFIDQNQKIFKSFPKEIKSDNPNMYSLCLDEVEKIKASINTTKKETQDYLKTCFRKHQEISLNKYKQLFSKRMTSAFADNWLYVSVRGDKNTVFYHDEDLTPRNINDEVIDISGSKIFAAHPYYYHDSMDAWIKLFADYDRTIEKLQLSTKFYNVIELMDDKGVITKFNNLTLSKNKVYFGLIQTEIFYHADSEDWNESESYENKDMFLYLLYNDIEEIRIESFDHNDIEKIISLSNQLHLIISAAE